MEDHDKAGSEIHGFVLFEKHAGNDTVNGMEKAVKEGPVKKEKLPELFYHRFQRYGGGNSQNRFYFSYCKKS